MDRQPKSFRILAAPLAAFIAAAALLTSGDAEAAKKSIAVHVEGPNADAVRSKITAIVPKGLDVVDASTFDGELAKAGQKQLGPAITAAKQRDKLVKAVRKAADAAHADAVIVARTRKVKGAEEVFVLLVEANDVSIDRGVAEESAALKDALGAALDRIAPPPEPEKKKVDDTPKIDDAPPPPPPEEEHKDRPPHSVPHEVFEVRVGGAISGRWFRYSTPLPAADAANLLRTYKVFGAGMLAVGGDLYPAATTKIPVLNNLGIEADLAHAFGLKSAIQNGGSIATSFDRWRVSLRERIRLGSSETPPVIGVRVGYGKDVFTFSDAPAALAAQIADASYGSLNLGLDARLPVSRLAFTFGFDYLAPLSHGAVYDRFRDASVKGIDLRFGLGLAIASGFEARFLLDYGRYFSSFKPIPGDQYVAGGALDQLLGLSLGVAYVY
jgi:hypothetical protein